MAIKTLAQLIVPITAASVYPDLLPADVIGTMITASSEEFQVKHGPIFGGEINRAPAKVQSALLEAMQDGPHHRRHLQVAQSLLVMAAKPHRAGGYLPAPEACRLLMLKVVITYPSKEEEKRIVTEYFRADHD